ncbi:MAG: hypothetical protein IKO06_05495, partial [Alphaproteobacteria bacterium]|nr:hypothetical protein [Alphaproteobacteria bacterium]
MRIFGVYDGTVKVMGGTVLKIKYKKGKSKFYAFGLPIFTTDTTFDALRSDFASNKSFDVRNFDNKIAEITDSYKNISKCKINNKRIAFLATKIYDM